MTKEQVLKQVEQRLGALSEDALRAIEVALDVLAAEHPGNGSGQEESPLAFVGSSPPWDELTRLSLEERSHIMAELEQRNKAWLEAKCREFGAMWLLVVDGQVLRWGASLGAYVTNEEKVEIGARTGKFPLYYEADWSLTIEETRWHTTHFGGDAYPTLPIQFVSGAVAVDVAADFDTGGLEIYADATLLQTQSVFTVEAGDTERSGTHLSSTYRYLPKPIEVRLIAADGADASVRPQRSAVRTVRCILDWHNSPFVSVNPHRTALVGRLTCLELQPTVVLDFAQRQTTVQF